MSFALHHPYVLAFEPSFIEVRHVETGALHQVITGYNLRCLFADVPPPASSSSSSASSAASSASSHLQLQHQQYGPPRPPVGFPPRPPPGYMGGYPGAPPGPPGAMTPYGGPGGFPPRPPPPGVPPGMSPYGLPPPAIVPHHPPRPPPQLQRNPVWESVAASRNQIVFIGDQTVFAVRLAGAGQ